MAASTGERVSLQRERNGAARTAGPPIGIGRGLRIAVSGAVIAWRDREPRAGTGSGAKASSFRRQSAQQQHQASRSTPTSPRPRSAQRASRTSTHLELGVLRVEQHEHRVLEPVRHGRAAEVGFRVVLFRLRNRWSRARTRQRGSMVQSSEGGPVLVLRTRRNVSNESNEHPKEGGDPMKTKRRRPPAVEPGGG